MGVAGLAFVGAGVGVGLSGSNGGGAGSSGSGSSGQGSSNALAPVLLGGIGVAIDAWALVYLLRGAQPVPALEVEPHAGPARTARSGLAVSPSGVGIRF
jgi:hypothetical protein